MRRSGRNLTRSRERETPVPAMRLSQAKELFLADRNASGLSAKYVLHLTVTFKDFADFLTATRRAQTVAILTTETLQAFAAWLKAKPRQLWRGSTERSANGIHGHMRDMRTMIRFLTEEGIINWRVKVPLPKVPKLLYPILSRAELAELYQSPMLAGKGETSLRNRTIFALLLDTGIRLAECAGLKPVDIKGRTHIQVTGKGDKQRYVPFGPQVGELLQQWLVVRETLEPLPEDSLFLLTDHGIGQVIERLSDKTEIIIFPHKIRHTACTLMLMRGMDLHSVSMLMGHTSISTTQTYLSLLPEDLQAKHAPASPFLAMQETIDQQVPEAPRKRRRLAS